MAIELLRGRSLVGGPAWVRLNHRGAQVNLIAGPVAAVIASAGSAASSPPPLRFPALLLGLGCGAVGVYDDIVGARPEQRRDKGFRGHLLALREGRISAGAVKVAGVVAASLAASGSVVRSPLDRLVSAGVMAGTANLVNLLDLRPGRAAKSSAIIAIATLAGPTGGLGAAVLGACIGVLPADLAEKVMLGDAGANALGGLLGLRLAAGSGPRGRAIILGILVGLTAASERVSFSRVIESTPGLREFDGWGRLPSRSSAMS